MPSVTKFCIKLGNAALLFDAQRHVPDAITRNWRRPSQVAIQIDSVVNKPTDDPKMSCRLCLTSLFVEA